MSMMIGTSILTLRLGNSAWIAYVWISHRKCSLYDWETPIRSSHWRPLFSKCQRLFQCHIRTAGFRFHFIMRSEWPPLHRCELTLLMAPSFALSFRFMNVANHFYPKAFPHLMQFLIMNKIYSCHKVDVNNWAKKLVHSMSIVAGFTIRSAFYICFQMERLRRCNGWNTSSQWLSSTCMQSIGRLNWLSIRHSAKLLRIFLKMNLHGHFDEI